MTARAAAWRRLVRRAARRATWLAAVGGLCAVAAGAQARVPVTVAPTMTVAPAALALSVGASGSLVASRAAGRRVQAVAADPGVASASAVGSVVTVAGVGAGSTTVTVTDGRTTFAALVTVVAAAAGAFRGSVVLGAPTATSVRANVYAPDQAGTVAIAWGTAPGAYPMRTETRALQAGVPVEFALSGLAPDTRHHYRLLFRPDGESATGATDERSFHTARPPGSAFTFALQGDSHPERAKTMFDAALYRRTLETAAADAPDFYLALGDDFSVDTLDPATLDAAKVRERYTLQRPWLGIVGRGAPLFLVNGNHEQAARCNLDGTPDNVAVWAQNARNALYPQPAPDAFYTGNDEPVPHIGLLRNYYAWTWGDALFVVIDPYWSSPVCVDAPLGGGSKRANLWDVTHGDAQYRWLQATLGQSRAKYKFVFAHHVMGTGRGGVELADLYEWGGLDPNGKSLFAAQRPAWALPIHDLLVRTGVTIFFQGHDHIWARQQLDGVTYQTLPVPADPNYALINAGAYRSGDLLPGTGYARVRVAPEGVTVDYVRTYLPADEGPGRSSGSTAFSYTIPAPAAGPQ